jgi:SecD/SecF fusion protein
MKRFFNRILICVIPTILSVLVVGWAYNEYQAGRGGFRLGVDLVGGTILVYEVDETKLPEKFSAADLAAALKRRIDPNDLYNITIRPVDGTPPRVEIILPTGGRHQAEAAERAWSQVLAAAARKFPVDGVSDPYSGVSRGRNQTTYLQQAILDGPWQRMLAEAAKKFPIPGRATPYSEIARDDTETLTKEILAGNKELDRKKVEEWVAANASRETLQGPDPKEVEEWVLANASAGSSRALTGDEVENIKGLISKQGRLEFKIVANSVDDKEAFDAAEKWFKDPKNQAELRRLNDQGLPPPPPTTADGKRTFDVTLQGQTEPYTYQWVMLGKSELWSLGLNSEALHTTGSGPPQLNALGKQLADFRARGEVFQPNMMGALAGKMAVLGSSLFYSREIPDGTWGLDSRPANEKSWRVGRPVEFFVLVRDGIGGEDVKGDDLTQAREGVSGRDGGRRAIDFQFSAEGGAKFYALTSRNVPSGTGPGAFHRHLAILFDSQVMSAPSLNSAISTNGQITGDFTQQEINDYVRILRAGALPATLKREPVSQNSMGATLGEDTIQKGTWSVLWSFVAVMVFMIFYYRFAGIVACIALLANLVITVAFMVLVNAAFTLPGLAGLVLMLGMAVDANVLIYERLREERARGASLQQALRNGYDKAIPTILDTHLSSIFTAIVLYVVGNDQLKGFGISLTVGLVISLFTSLYMTRTMFEVWFAEGWIKEFVFFEGLVKLIHIRYWDFMSIRNYWFTATAILTLLGAALFVYRLDSDPSTGKATVLNIDFTGGTAITARLSRPMTLQELRDRLEKPIGDDKPLPDMAIEQLFPTGPGAQDSGGGSTFFTLRTSDKSLKSVEAFVQRRLQGELKLLKMQYKLPANAGARDSAIELSFTDEKGEKDWASPSQIQTLLNRQFTDKGAARASFTLERPSAFANAEGLYSQLTLRLREEVEKSKLEEILAATAKELSETPQPERLENFDKQLAESTQTRALYAILASWIAILLYLWFRFGSWTFGAAAVVCLIHDLIFTLGAIAACHYIYTGTPWLAWGLGIQDFKIDLPAVAALLTLVGYSVNDTIVVFDRIREVRGKNPALTFQMINDSVNQTLTRTLLASATVLLVVLVLYIFGGEGVKLFAFVMIVGVFVGTYSSIYIASPLLVIFGEGRVHSSLTDKPATARQ